MRALNCRRRGRGWDMWHRQRESRHFPSPLRGALFRAEAALPQRPVCVAAPLESREDVTAVAVWRVVGTADVDMCGRLALSLRTPENMTKGDGISDTGLPKRGPETGAI